MTSIRKILSMKTEKTERDRLKQIPGIKTEAETEREIMRDTVRVREKEDKKQKETERETENEYTSEEKQKNSNNNTNNNNSNNNNKLLAKPEYLVGSLNSMKQMGLNNHDTTQ